MSRAVFAGLGCALAALLAAAPAAAIDWADKLSKAVETAKDVKSAVMTPEEDEERQMGQDVAATLLGASKPLANPAIQQYVNRVGLWVALQGSRPELPWRFAVLDNPNVNAFATPGGYVFITRGLLERLNSEAELAGALGHEIAHVEKKHHLKAMKKDAGMKLLGKGATKALGSAGSAEDRERLGQVAGVAKGLYARGLDKDDEFDADKRGVVLATRAGYDPYGLAQVLQTLDSVNADSTQFALLFKTHPKPAERLLRLDQSLGAKLEKLGARPAVAERFVKTVRK
jgi:beta-barrel assembly-enhancing protease